MAIKIESLNNLNTTLRVTGPEEEVEKWRQEYFTSWHPAGYGTYVRDRIRNDDGTLTIVTRRFASCD